MPDVESRAEPAADSGPGADAAAAADSGTAVDVGTDVDSATDSGTDAAAAAEPGDDDASRDEPAAPHVDPTLLAGVPVVAVVGAALAFGGRHSALGLLVAVAVVQALFGVAWVLGTGMPGRRGGLVLATLAAVAADVVVSVWPHGRLGALVAVLGLAVPVMFVHQLSRGAARIQLVSSLSAVSLLVVGEVALPALLQLRHEFLDGAGSGRVVEAVAASIAVALIAGYFIDMVLPVPRFDADVPRGVLALVGAAIAGGAVGHLVLRDDAQFVGGRGMFVGAALGALAGLLAVASAFVLFTTSAPPARLGRALRPALAAALPFCLLAPAAFLLCLAIRS